MKKRPKLGEIAVEEGLINSAELKRALKGQEMFRLARQSIRLGDLLVGQEYLTAEQRDRLVRLQRSRREGP